MNPFTVRKPAEKHEPDCAEFITLAERELAAFFRAVMELFGSEPAECSAEDWLQELESIKNLPASPREWRLITARVTARLANRMNALVPITEPAI